MRTKVMGLKDRKEWYMERSDGGWKGKGKIM